MPRVINPEEYQQKRGEILAAAQKLIYTKGYEQMSVQDILSELGISKGAFYHYFDSKQALIEAMVKQMMVDMEIIVRPITENPHISSLEKFEQFFGKIAQWKSARKAFLTQLFSVWYTDDNAIVRQKITLAGVNWVSPFLAQIIRQGKFEGKFDVEDIEETAKVVVAMMMNMGESIAECFLKLQPGDDQLRRQEHLLKIEKSIYAYQNAIERVLGAPIGSISLFDPNLLREWFLE